MNLRSQSGMTLVELVLAMTITAAVLAALTSVLFGANLVSSAWGQRTYLAEAAQVLPSALQSDVHRYVPCPGQPGANLNLCLPGGTAPMVTYSAAPGCPCDLVRTDRQLGTSTLVVRALAQAPSFTATCATVGPVDSGSITVVVRYHGDTAPQPPMVVYFRAPAGACGP